MAKHIIFLVHGVGDTTPGWSAPVVETIKTAYRQYQVSNLMPFDQFFEFEEINYNAAFDGRREQWKTDSDGILAALKEGGFKQGGISKLATYAAEPSKEGFLNTHALDVVFYRYISLVGEQVRASVRAQMLAKIAAQAGVTRWSVIAHSLGTIVTHDVLHQMFWPTPPADWPVLPAGTFRPDVVMMLANVGSLLENKAFFGANGDVYRSCVYPSADPEKGACRYFINVRHEWDPVPKPRMFRPTDDWPDVATRAQNRYVNVPINAIRKANVHDYAHYLENPASHVPLFRLLTVPALLPDTETEPIRLAYEASTPLSKFKKEVERLKALSLSEAETDWRKILPMLRDYFSEFQA